MSDVQEYAARLSKTIGPRPAGTEEEQQASFFIEEVLQQEAGLEVQTEEFNCNPNFELPRIVCCVLSIILGALSLVLDVMLVPALIGCLILAALYIFDVMGIFSLARTGKHGVSQNIVGKYYPPSNEQSQASRRRKIILVARYDSGKIARELRGPAFRALPVIRWVELCAMALMPIILVIRMIMKPEGTAEIVFMVLTIILMVCVFLPVLSYIMRKTAPYSDGANCNAAGVAVMADVAKRIGLGLYDTEDEFEPIIHGSRAAREEDLIPSGAEVVYADEEDELEDGIPATLPLVDANGQQGFPYPMDTAQPDQTSFMEPMSMDASQQEWQAAAAANAGIPPIPGVSAPVAVPGGMPSIPVTPTMPAGVPPAPAAPAAPAAPEEDDSSVPSWYKRARQNANRASADSIPAQRSRFADALDNAVAVSQAAAAEAAAQVQSQPSDIEQRLEAMRQSIMGTAAPVPSASEGTETPAAHPQAGVGGFLSNTMASTDYATSQANAAAPIVMETEMERAANVTDRIISGSPSSQPTAAAPAEKAPQRKKRTIALPSLTGAINAAEVAALAEEGASSDNRAAKSGASAGDAGSQEAADRRHSKQASLANSLPSLDDAPSAATRDRKKNTKTQTSNIVSQAGSFAVAHETSSFKPVGDELVANMDIEDIYIEDADDSDYGDSITESGAMAGPGYVDMPSSRASRVFGKFRRGKKKQEESLADAIGVGRDFDARKVGKERGGWESFREDNLWEEDEWNGGAFSRENLGRAISRIKPGSAKDEPMPGDDFYEEGEDYPESYAEEGSARSGSRGASGRILNPFADIPLRGLSRSEDRDMMHDFHNGPINMEVWFVALGAELANNAGMKSFLSQHSSELRGAMIIDLDGLGAGELCMIEREGAYRVAKMSSRMKRYVRKAADSLGMKVGSSTMLWHDSAAYCAVKNGYQTLHLAGMMNGKPARMAEADDTYDNLDIDVLTENADFTMELIRSI